MAQLWTAGLNTKNISIGVLDEFMEWQSRQSTGDIGAFAADRYVADMYRAVTLRALGVSTMPFRVETEGGVVLTTSGEYDPKVLGFLPNPRRLLHLTEQSRTLMGRCYYYRYYNRMGTTALEYLTPTAVRPKYKNNVNGGTLEAWEVYTTTGWKVVPLDDIVYGWMPDASVGNAPPLRYPAQAALSAAGIELNLDKFVELFFKRGAIKATIFTLEGNPPKQELERMEEWAKSWLTGIINAFQTKFFPVGKVNPLVVGEGVKELENQDLEASQSRKIAKAMMIPMAIFNSESSSGLGGGGVASQDAINFLKQCIMPECDDIAETWNEQLFAPLGLRWVWEYENLDELHDDEAALATTANQYADLIDKCETYEKWEALADMTGIEYDEDKFKKVFALKESRRVESANAETARLEAQARQPQPANMDVSKPEPKQLEAGDEVKSIGGGNNGLVTTNTVATVGDTAVSALRGDNVDSDGARIRVPIPVVDSAKALERKQYRTFAAKASNAGKVFKFAYLDAGEQAELTGVKKKNVKSVDAVSRQFCARWKQRIKSAFEDDTTNLDSDLREILEYHVTSAYTEGLLEAGIDAEDFTDEDTQDADTLYLEQTEHLGGFVEAVLEAVENIDARAGVLARAELWCNAIQQIGDNARNGATDGMFEFVLTGDASEESCETCSKLLGKKHRWSWVVKNGYEVQAGNERFECGCFNCPHSWEPVGKGG